MGTLKYIGYHATDIANVENILKNNFTFIPNDVHWLGDGVYFFVDYGLTEMWAQKPSNRYGKINTAEIIKANIIVNSDQVYDMRNIFEYNYVKEQFDLFWESIVNSEVKLKKANCWRIRCAFFNWFKQQTKCKCIVALFYEREKLSNKTDKEEFFTQFKMPYVEVQICVNDVNCIKTRRVYKV